MNRNIAFAVDTIGVTVDKLVSACQSGIELVERYAALFQTAAYHLPEHHRDARIPQRSRRRFHPAQAHELIRQTLRGQVDARCRRERTADGRDEAME